MVEATEVDADELPEITKIETLTRVGTEQRPAYVVWFDGERALRYVWNEEIGQIEEETYVDGVVHSSYRVGGSREELAEYALESVAEYVNELSEDPEALAFDWGQISEMLLDAAEDSS